jgi:zinc/manganese transport system ATP-binding protein
MNESAIEFKEAAVAFGDKIIWSEGNFSIPPSSINAIIGPNGSGKTTMLRTILGSLPLSRGSVNVFGAVPGKFNKQIGYVPQDYTVNNSDNIRVQDVVSLGLVGYNFGIHLINKEQKRLISNALKSVDAEHLQKARLSSLSGGQKQRVSIAQAIVANPKLLILDEPLANLDVHSQKETINLIKRLNSEHGITILVVTHDLYQLIGIIDGIVYLFDGHAHYEVKGDSFDEELFKHIYGRDDTENATKRVATVIGDFYVPDSASGARSEESK